MTDYRIRNGVDQLVPVEDIPEVESELVCPVCDEPFDRREWPDGGGFVSPRAGGSDSYRCPNDCDGKITLLI